MENLPALAPYGLQIVCCTCPPARFGLEVDKLSLLLKKRGMKLSLKLEYACRALAQLARIHEQGSLAHVELLADHEQIPANYLVQILNELRNANIVISRRGKSGGYALARGPEQISLAEIVRAVDPDLLEPKLRPEGQSGPRVSQVWSDISDQLVKTIGGFTLWDLVDEKRGEMYYI